MKKLFLIFFFGACCFGAYAQYWNLTGNSGTTTSNFIGTTSAQPLIFKANNSERMRLLSNGNFGIGITTPQAILHLHDSRLMGSTILPEDSTNIRGEYTILRITTANSLTNGFSIHRNSNVNNSASLFLKQHEQAPLYIEGPNGGFMIAADGNIGMGTNKPKQKLHIVDGNILISKTSTKNAAPGSTNGSILFGADIDPNLSTNVWGIEYLNSNQNGYGLNFWKCWTNGPGGEGFNHALFLADNGNVGIGTQAPQAKLDVDGSVFLNGRLGIGTIDPKEKMQIGDIWTFQDGNDKTIGRNTYNDGRYNLRITTGTANRIYFSRYGEIVLQTAESGAANSVIDGSWNTVTMSNNGNVGIGVIPTVKLDVNGAFKASSANISGNVGIGLTNPSVKLDVNGIVRAHEVKVCVNQGCDFVFDDDYKLMSLQDLNHFINTHKHLPNVAPAAEMEAEGINLSEMNALLLQKVEELTLYIIQMEKRLAEVENRKGGE